MVFSLFVAILLIRQFLVVRSELICDPTVKPKPDFHCDEDAKKLYTDGKDDEGNARLLFHRSLDQRKSIRDYYDSKFFWTRKRRCGRHCYYDEIYPANLSDELGRQSLYNLDKLYDMTFTNFEDILTGVVHGTITRDWKEVGGIEEVLCANDNEMKKLLRESYEKNFKIKMEEDFKTFNKKTQRIRMLCSNIEVPEFCFSLQPDRCQDKKISKEQAAEEAKALHDIDIENEKEKFKDKLKEFLNKYCEPDLKLIFQAYRKDDTHGIDTDVEKVFEGEERRVYDMIVRYIEDTCKCYADELHKAVKGGGCDYDKVHRIILTRSERDLKCILDNFRSRKDQTFTERLKEETPLEKLYLTSIRYLCGNPE
ncbi:annexin A13-like [Planococcus citri]|uniref:annexin A13-like n=1 Tax=Planococcus citri TaxID=170843 RepID=UPI0031F86A8D